MKQDGGGLLGYLWAGLTGIFTALSVQDISIMLGALVTAALGVMTYISNDRRNRRIAAAEEARNVILSKYYDSADADGRRPPPPIDSTARQEADG